MSPAEAELLIKGLSCIPVTEVGSARWKQQRIALEQLNMCTHSNAALKKDDWVKTFLIEQEQLPTLLHEMLVMEAWRQKVASACVDEIAANPVAPYMYCMYESVLVNFLECICFHEEVVTGFGDDVLELIDYCWRQVCVLFSEPGVGAAPAQSVEELQKETPRAKLLRQLREGRVSRALSCLSILWFIVDRVDALPMAAANALLQKNDLPVGLSDVLLLQPWTRRSATETFKYISGTFAPVAGDDVLRVCVPEAHTWFCMHKLLCDPECRRRYAYTQHKKESILRVRRFLNDTLVDQIPALESVQRALEELSFLQPPSGTEEKFKSTLIIEQVPRLLSSIAVPGNDWGSQVQRAKAFLADPRERQWDAMQVSQLFEQMFANQE